MELVLQISKLEVFVPENLYEPKTMALCIQLSCDIKMNTYSNTLETFKRDRLKTLIESQLKNSESNIDIKLKGLQIFFEQQLDYSKNVDFRDQAMPEVLYFLKPYNLHVKMDSKKKLHSKDDTDSYSVIIVTGETSFDLQLGLRELNSYLIIAQIYFQFMNDLTVI